MDITMIIVNDIMEFNNIIPNDFNVCPQLALEVTNI